MASVSGAVMVSISSSLHPCLSIRHTRNVRLCDTTIEHPDKPYVPEIGDSFLELRCFLPNGLAPFCGGPAANAAAPDARMIAGTIVVPEPWDILRQANVILRFGENICIAQSRRTA